MEGKLTKRRRIYSVEPSKIAQAEFARIYLSHLVPALMKVNQKKEMKKKSTVYSSEEEEDDDDDEEKKNSCVNVVKHEVGMAMVCSAPPGFAWSKALKAKFQTDHTNAGITTKDDGGDHHHMNNAPPSPYNFSVNPTTGSSKSCVHNEEEEEEEAEEEGEGEEEIEEGFERLRRLIPGGEEMGEDEEEMVKELESYISCLQMQVNILQCLAENTTP